MSRMTARSVESFDAAKQSFRSARRTLFPRVDAGCPNETPRGCRPRDDAYENQLASGEMTRPFLVVTALIGTVGMMMRRGSGTSTREKEFSRRSLLSGVSLLPLPSPAQCKPSSRVRGEVTIRARMNELIDHAEALATGGRASGSTCEPATPQGGEYGEDPPRLRIAECSLEHGQENGPLVHETATAQLAPPDDPVTLHEGACTFPAPVPHRPEVRECGRASRSH